MSVTSPCPAKINLFGQLDAILVSLSFFFKKNHFFFKENLKKNEQKQEQKWMEMLNMARKKVSLPPVNSPEKLHNVANMGSTFLKAVRNCAQLWQTTDNEMTDDRSSWDSITPDELAMPAMPAQLRQALGLRHFLLGVKIRFFPRFV